jgi:hypothetical protein
MSLKARDHLIAALQADLVGPYDPESGQEVLRLPPIRWYLTGFLVPEGGAQSQNEGEAGGDEDESLESGDDISGDSEGASTEPEAKQRPIMPSSFGLTLLLPTPAPGQKDCLEVEIKWGEYRCRSNAQEVEALCKARGMKGEKYLPGDHRKQPVPLWERVVLPAQQVSLDLAHAHHGRLCSVAVGGGLKVEYRLETIAPEHARLLRLCDDGRAARAISVFLVNARAMSADRETQAQAYSRELNESAIFQVSMEVRSPFGILPRPDVHFARSDDFDDQMVDLQFRNELEWAVGHGIAAQAIARDPEKKLDARTNPAQAVRTVWMPQTSVAQVRATSIEGVEVRMRALAELKDGDAIDQALGALPKAYAQWIATQEAIALREENHVATQRALVARATTALERIKQGIALLRDDAQVRQTFVWVNQAMAEVAQRKRRGVEPQWRLFQLAFLLLNLRSIACPEDPDREKVELLFFPTGGGKTEAYLGVIATTLILRRLRGQDRPDAGLGVTVMLRYTLRLLTLDQLGRAAALICSLELLRRRHPAKLGVHRFSIGLWVGRSGTPNTMDEAKKAIEAFRGRTADSKGSPFPLATCPWCDTPIEARGMDTLPHGKGSPTRTLVVCANRDCEFSSARGNDGTKVGELPVLFVDEQIYRELPDFLVSTVDKFAMLTHRGEAGKLFGKVHSYKDNRGEARVFFGGGDSEKSQRAGTSHDPLSDGLRPPELIIQDELHLISGPLGTMVGLFETMVEALCKRSDASGKTIVPKIIAATATVRRASTQVQALYARPAEATCLFPPQGVNAWETFFAQRDRQANERMYVGLAAAGRSMKRILLQSYLTLLGAGEHFYESDADSARAADPYKTVVGYFNSLRELGGMRRLVDDEIQTRVRRLDERTPEDAKSKRAHRWLSKREIGEPIELTSRVSTADIIRDKDRLATRFDEYAAQKAEKSLDAQAPKPVDVALASNMIAVGVDISRLGLMVVAGQPKTTSEYIQASSRVGRDDARPGLVVTVYNLHKPRDRSYYEHFVAYHESFYRYVEAQSVTPFSLPALDRGLASVFVGMMRHLGGPTLASPTGAAHYVLVGQHQEAIADALAERADRQPDAQDLENGANIRSRCIGLAHKWRKIVQPTDESRGSEASFCYSPYEKKKAVATRSLMRLPEDDAKKHPSERPAANDSAFPFVAPTSLRDVEASTAIWIRRKQS